MPTKSGQTDKSEIRKNELTFRAGVSILKHVDKTRGACVQAERKLRTSTHIPDLDNANVGMYNVDFRRDAFSWYLSFLLLCDVNQEQ